MWWKASSSTSFVLRLVRNACKCTRRTNIHMHNNALAILTRKRGAFVWLFSSHREQNAGITIQCLPRPLFKWATRHLCRKYAASKRVDSSCSVARIMMAQSMCVIWRRHYPPGFLSAHQRHVHICGRQHVCTMQSTHRDPILFLQLVSATIALVSSLSLM